MILRRKRRMDAEVPLSPLIDCVFLLLIFFLVTMMLKKTEKQIPIVMPDAELSLAVDADQEVLTLGVDKEGNVFEAQRGTTLQDMIGYVPVDDLPLYLQQLASEQGTQIPIQLAVERLAKTQKVVDLLDIFQIQGFENVAVRIRDGAPVGTE